MSDRLCPYDDFEATIRIYRPDEGGRRTAAFNGIRWDFAYADDSPLTTLHAIYPDFINDGEQSLSADQPLPVGVELPARMLIRNEAMRATHRSRLARGVRFFCHEGPRRVAEGVITRITGLDAR